MERVAFLIEETGERLTCLLNPEKIELRRVAGLHRRPSSRGPLVASDGADDPILSTGGGSTEMELHLLFDLALADGDRSVGDVRKLTRPLWQLAEGRPAAVRFIWGKTWNMPALVAAVAERLEQFDTDGAPRRSWLALRLLRTAEPTGRGAAAGLSGGGGRPRGGRPPRPSQLTRRRLGAPGGGTVVRELPGDGGGRSAERLDQVAESQYGDPAYWRLVASANGLDDPFAVPVGTRLRLPGGGSGS